MAAQPLPQSAFVAFIYHLIFCHHKTKLYLYMLYCQQVEHLNLLYTCSNFD
jgi:hypothetical protein